MRPLKVGLFLTPWSESKERRVLGWSDLLARASEAERVGFDSIWVSDHLLMRFTEERSRGGWEGWSQIAALSAVVPRVEIGALVLCAVWRNPALLAKMAVTADEISGGRFILGLGAGWHEPEFRAFGYPFDESTSRGTVRLLPATFSHGVVAATGPAGDLQREQERDCEMVGYARWVTPKRNVDLPPLYGPGIMRVRPLLAA